MKKNKRLTKLELNDFSELPTNSTIKDVEYLGWSYFSRDYINFHFVIQKKYYYSCVHNKRFLENNYEFLKVKGATILEYNGIKKNSKRTRMSSSLYVFSTFLERKI